MAESVFTDKQKDSIMASFLDGVKNAERRRKIIRLAAVLGDASTKDDSFYAVIYKYSKPDNWVMLEQDYQEFVIPGDFGSMNDDMYVPAVKPKRK